MVKVYFCTRCGRGEEDGVTRDDLSVKKVVFLRMGEGGKVIRSRVVEWLCPTCRSEDADWKREAFVRPDKAAEATKKEEDELAATG